MDAQKFLADFRHIASAPNGIKQLRQMIYQLAVTGALTPTDSRLSDAGALLEEIRATRSRLIRDKAYKRMLELEGEPIRPPLGVSLPPSWRWTRLVDIGEINPRNEAAESEIAAFLPMSGVPQQHRVIPTAELARWGDVKKGYTHFAVGDVILAKITPCFENGKAASITNLPDKVTIGAGTTELHVFRPIHSGVLSEYVYLFLRSPLFVNEGQKKMTGTAGQKRLPTDYFATRSFPLPPTEEQMRIVARVDELMLLCDRLEQELEESRKLQAAARRSAVQSVMAAVSPHELQVTWTRLVESFGQLFTTPEDVAPLRQLILDLAIGGWLTATIADAEPASQLVERSRAAKTSRLATGQMKRKASMATDIIRLDLVTPEHWKRAALEDLFQFIDYRGKTPPKTDSGVVLVTAKNVRPGKLNRDPVEYISETSYNDWMTRGFPEVGDLLFTTEAPLGNVARIETEPNFALAQRIINLQPFADMDTRCAMYFMLSPTFQALLDVNSTGMTAKGIKAAKLKQLELPVPPLAEQSQIVARVDRLMHYCDELEVRLRDAKVTSEKLAVVCVSELSGIAIDLTEEEPMKAPKTELVAPVRLSRAPDIKAQAPLATLLARHEGEMSAVALWQRFGGPIDDFYAQLKAEVARGWIEEPSGAQVRESLPGMVGT